MNLEGRSYSAYTTDTAKDAPAPIKPALYVYFQITIAQNEDGETSKNAAIENTNCFFTFITY